jgi:uncharacterized protein involved in outer membrane biogenesis
MTRPLHPALRLGLVVLGVVAVLALVVMFFPWSVLRGPLERHIAHELHRPVTVGALDVDPGWTTHVAIGDLTIGNADWSADARMAHADLIELEFALLSLLRLEPDAVRLRKPDLLLEKSDDGKRNWDFGDDTADFWPRLRAIDIDDGKIRYRDPSTKADTTLDVHSEIVDGAPSLRVNGKGKLRGEAFELNALGRGLASLRRQRDPYPLTLAARAGATKVDFSGTVVPGEPENLRGTLHLTGPDLSQLYPIVPSPLPWTPPYNLKGELAHGGKVWTFRNFNGIVGDSDLSGEFRVDLSKPRAMTTADLKSARFDYKDLGGFIGLPPGERSATTAAQRKEETKRAASTSVMPEKPLDVSQLRESDADVRFRGTAVKFADTPIDNLVSHLVLKDGILRFDPLDFGIADGHIVSNVVIDVNQSVPRAQAEINARNVELKRIFPKLAAPSGSAGRVAGRAKFKSHGSDMKQLFANADGAAAMSMRGGEASTLTLVLTNLDLARAGYLLFKGDETAEITCAVTGFHVEQGVATPEVFVVDSSAEVITGSGTIDLAHERYDLRLKAKSKKPSLIALRGPIAIVGTFKQPAIHPEVAPVVARVGAAIGLGVVSPPLAVLPLIDLGGAQDIDCRGMNEAAREKTGTTERIARSSKDSTTPKSAGGKQPPQASRSMRPNS